MPGFRSVARLAARPLVPVLLWLAGGCTDADPPTALGSGSVRLNVSATVAAAQDERVVEITVAYRRSTGEWVPLPSEPRRVSIVAGDTKQQPVVVNLAPCLQDPRRQQEATEQCVLRVEMRLMTTGGQVIGSDTREAGSVAAGATVTLPAITLGPPVMGVSSESVRFDATSELAAPAAQLVRLTSTRSDGTPGGAPLGAISASVAYGPGADGWLTATVDQAAVAVSLQPARSTLAPGSYSARVTLSAAAPGVQPRSVDVTYRLTAPLALTVAGGGRGDGRVTVAGAIDCAVAGGAATGACGGRFAPDAQVTLVATPSASHTFGGWGGACSGTEPTCTLRMTEARAVTATFVPPRQRLDVGGAGQGSGVVTAASGGVDCSISEGAGAGSCAASFDFGTAVTLTARAAQGSSFTGWTGACTGTGPCVVTMDQARAVTATFAALSYPLGVGISGLGAGNVGGTGGIDCSRAADGPTTGTCTATLRHGATATLTATPAPNSTFAGWAGACAGTGACTVGMTSAQSVTAVFAPAARSLTVGVTGSGTGAVTASAGGIDCRLVAGVPAGTCTGVAPHGTVVTLSAGADAASSVFTGWSGACAGTQPTCTVTLDQARAVGATFTRVARTLTISGTANGTVTISVGGSPDAICTIAAGQPSASCTASVVHGAQVRLRATPAANNQFLDWEGACSGTAGPECVVTTDQARHVVARFGLIPRELRVLGAGDGGGTVASTNVAGIACTITTGVPAADCAETLGHGSVVVLHASPRTPDSEFARWSGGACDGSTAPTCAVALDQARTVTARFDVKSYTVTVGVAGNGSGSVTSSVGGIDCRITLGVPSGGPCSASIKHGQTVTFTATAAPGSTLAGAIGDCTVPDPGSDPRGTSRCTTQVTRVMSGTATFDLLRSLSVSGTGDGNGHVMGDLGPGTPGVIACDVRAGTATGTCATTLAHGTTVRLTAIPNAGHEFLGWSGACAGSGACTVPLDQARAVTARFGRSAYTATASVMGGGVGSLSLTSSNPADGLSGPWCSHSEAGVTTCPGRTAARNVTLTFTATPATGNAFRWTSGPCANGSSPTCSVAMTADVALSATFEAPRLQKAPGEFDGAVGLHRFTTDFGAATGLTIHVERTGGSDVFTLPSTFDGGATSTPAVARTTCQRSVFAPVGTESFFLVTVRSATPGVDPFVFSIRCFVVASLVAQPELIRADAPAGRAVANPGDRSVEVRLPSGPRRP